MTIDITISGVDRVLNRLGNIDRKFGTKFEDECGKEVMRVYAKNISGSFDRNVSYPSGSTSSKIREKKVQYKGKQTWGVVMPIRAFYVERGRKPGKMPPENKDIERWARRAWGSSGLSKEVWWLRHTIGEEGTMPRPFIRQGIMNSRQRVRRILTRHVKNALSKGG